MLRYNISIEQAREATRLSDARVAAGEAVRWTGAGREPRPSLAAIGAAMLLHVAAGVLALAFVRIPAPPQPPDDQTMTLVFASPEAAPEPPAPSEAAPEPPAPPEAATPPPQPPIEQPPLPVEPPPPPPPEEVLEAPKLEPPKPEAPPPVLHKPAARTKPGPPARVAAPPFSTAAELPKAPAPAQKAAEPPIAADWQRALAAWLAAHKTYPELARRRGVEGSVVLRFTANRSGHVLDVSLLSSAGSPVLDGAAEAMVRDAALPPFTAAMLRDTVSVTVTIRYALTK